MSSPGAGRTQGGRGFTGVRAWSHWLESRVVARALGPVRRGRLQQTPEPAQGPELPRCHRGPVAQLGAKPESVGLPTQCSFYSVTPATRSAPERMRFTGYECASHFHSSVALLNAVPSAWNASPSLPPGSSGQTPVLLS